MKYCSDHCRGEGARLKREKWEEETDYNERQRKRMAAQRRNEREDSQRVTTSEHRKNLKKQALEARQLQKEKRNKLEKLAEQGDSLAMMQISKPNSFEYWEAYRAYELKTMTDYTNSGVRFINEISVLDNDFTEKVMESIKQQRIIRSELVRVQKNTN